MSCASGERIQENLRRQARIGGTLHIVVATIIITEEARCRSRRTCQKRLEETASASSASSASTTTGGTASEIPWAGGTIKGTTTCTPPGGGKTVMTMDGRYGPQSIDMTMKSQTDIAGKAMTMEMRVSGKRVGECSAATKEG